MREGGSGSGEREGILRKGTSEEGMDGAKERGQGGNERREEGAPERGRGIKEERGRKGAPLASDHVPDTIQGDTTCIQDAARTCSPVPPRSDPVPQRQAGSSFCRHTAECSDDSVSDIWGSSVLLHWTDLVVLAPI